jgi:maleamate amidohydrolase
MSAATGTRIWDAFLTPRDRAVFASAGFGRRAGMGKRPALLVIDVSYAFTGERDEPILEAIEQWPNACGEDAWAAVPVIRGLIDACRAKGLPVIYTTGVVRPDHWDVASWAWKNGRTDESTKGAGKRPTNRDGNAIVDEIAPEPEDIVVLKQKPSGFFGTPLQSYLQLLACDGVIVTGTTTSGCVRATVIDAFSQNFRVTIAEDGCFDRSQASHAVNLCDMHAKYADVLPSGDIIGEIEALPDGLFAGRLPAGAA